MGNHKHIRAFLISSIHETDRKSFVEKLIQDIPGVRQIEAIYPQMTHVPFLEKLKVKSKFRAGRSLNDGEIGLILTSRKIWREIINISDSDEESFLILESDSKIDNTDLLNSYFHRLTSEYDIFFWGAWSGKISLLRSKKKRVHGKYFYGIPLINSVAGTYGYSINKKAASCLLKATTKISYPVDEFKKYLEPGQLRFGGILPEVIKFNDIPSTIGHQSNEIKEKIWIFILQVRNKILSLLK